MLKGVFVGNQILWVKVLYQFVKEINQLRDKHVQQIGFINTLLNNVDSKAVLDDLSVNEEFKKIMDEYKKKP